MKPFPSRSSQGKSSHKLRGLRVVFLLMGLAVCIQMWETPRELIAHLTLGEPIEPIVLHPADNIKFISEMVFPQMHMDSSVGFQRITNNKHIWAYMQVVEVRNFTGLVYYYQFKDESGASECVTTIRAIQDFGVPHEAHQFGTYVVLAMVTHTTENPSPFFETVFGQITQNMKP